MADPIPSCPELARTSSLPPVFMRTAMGDYEGAMTANQIVQDERVIVLVPSGRVDEHIELTFNFGLSPHFRLGKRVQASLQREAGARAPFELLVLRDDAGAVLLAHHAGQDDLYQDGVFASPEAIGVTLAVTIECQSTVTDGACFRNQIQTEHVGTFDADTKVILDNYTDGEITIGGAPYFARFIGNSVDGDVPVPDSGCDFAPYRHIMFTLLRK